MRNSKCFPSNNHRARCILATSLTILFILIATVTIFFLVRARTSPTISNPNQTPTNVIKRACGFTLYRDVCVNSFMDLPGWTEISGPEELARFSMNMTRQHVGRAVYDATALTATDMAPMARSAYDVCMELLYDSCHHLEKSMTAAESLSLDSLSDDVLTWLGAVVTNQDTCEEGLEQSGDTFLKPKMMNYFKDLSKLMSNNLAIYSNQDFVATSDSARNNGRRKLLRAADHRGSNNGFPNWVKRSDRRLLQVPASEIQADMIVSKYGVGTYKKIADAVKGVPENNPRRTIIYVKAGVYRENIKIGRKKTNVMFVGDGVGKTVITGSRSVLDNYTTYHTATFASSGAGFIMRDMTVENNAGPERHQAVALRVSADHAVVYRCNITGHQDTLYVHSQRQFYRDCDIYGTVDFIFGNAAVVLQNCNIWARKPLPGQKNTITAQNRKDPNQITGISIHTCRLRATPELNVSKRDYPTYLGRPWKMYARTVYMETFMDDHVSPTGWLEWNGTFALQTLYYGEYRNTGPGSLVDKRVMWPGYRVITIPDEARKFTVARFIGGFSWLPPTGVSFLAGLGGK